MLFKSSTFFPILGIHILAGLVCALAGIVTVVSRKRVGLHPLCGTIYHWGLAVLVTSAGVLATANWTNDRVLLILGFIGLGLRRFCRLHVAAGAADASREANGAVVA